MATTDVKPLLISQFPDLSAKVDDLVEENRERKERVDQLVAELEDMKQQNALLRTNSVAIRRSFESERRLEKGALPGPAFDLVATVESNVKSIDEENPYFPILRAAMMLSLEDSSVLVALCVSRQGSWSVSRLDLNHRLENRWGSFKPGRGFKMTACNVQLEVQDETKSVMLRGELRDGDGAWKPSHFDLTKHLAIKNGNLVFQTWPQDLGTFSWIRDGPTPLWVRESLIVAVCWNLNSRREWRTVLGRIPNAGLLFKYAVAMFGLALIEALSKLLGGNRKGNAEWEYVGGWLSRDTGSLVGAIVTKARSSPDGERIIDGVCKTAAWMRALESLPSASLATEVSRVVSDIIKGDGLALEGWNRVQKEAEANWHHHHIRKCQAMPRDLEALNTPSHTEVDRNSIL